MFQNAYCNVICERPPRPCQFGTDSFFDGTATPPFQGGESTFPCPVSRFRIGATRPCAPLRGWHSTRFQSTGLRPCLHSYAGPRLGPRTRRSQHRPKIRAAFGNVSAAFDTKAKPFVEREVSFIESFKITGQTARVRSRQHRFNQRSTDRLSLL